jgi:CDP-diacylglycerol pyrophosphatase
MKLSHPAASWIGALAVFSCALVSPAVADHPDALWRVVHGLCLGDMRLMGHPAPCLRVDLHRGYAVVPDPKGRRQILVVPTNRIAGIESAALLEPGAPNYWQAAWDARGLFERRARRPIARDLVGMAINSAHSRSQDQLHIHVDCIRPVLRDALAVQANQIGLAWTPLRVPLMGWRWQVRSVRGEELGDRDPFKMLVRGDPGAKSHMDRETLVVVGATLADGAPGFYLLKTSDGAGFGEGMLDHRCAVLDRAPGLKST